MAELVVTQDELALRRRARRRLVGAVAIALTVVVALPMLFDSEPKPLGPEVDIRIPAQDTPFEPAPALAPPLQSMPSESQPAAQPAEPTQPAAPAATQDKEKPGTTPPGAGKKAESSASSSTEKSRLAAKPEAKPEARQPLKPDTTFSSQGYFLQLGAFGNEQNARQLQSKASAAGFQVMMVGANGQYRVRVGPIPQHARALEMQARLKAKGFSPVMLGP